MKNRSLGQIGTQISCIGLGGMSFSDAYGKTDTKQTHDILSSALDLGINHIDTAYIYGMGNSEKRIGEYFTKNKGSRDKFIIATKGGIETGKNGERRFNNSKSYLKKSLEESLRRLCVDQVELYYVHRREAERPIEEVTQTLSEFVKEGKVNQIGFSEISPSSLNKASKIFPIGAIQSEYSLSTRYPELGILQKSEEIKATLVAFSPLGRSLLTDKPHNIKKAQTLNLLKENPRFLEPNLSHNIKITDAFRELASDMGISSAALAIAWLLHKGKNIVPIPGTRSTKHLKSLSKGSEVHLKPEELNEIDKILPVGWAHGDRYSVNQWVGPEKYC
tara:strand:- start:1391 stop:2389 length:999 start_codon:yes stop_codon:yes gene_type:complete